MRKRYGLKHVLAITLLCTQANALSADSSVDVDADILLVGGMIHRGDGEPSAVGSVAITGDRITAVGDFKVGSVKKEIDCSGLIISPGFIDLHNHSDRQVLQKTTRAVVNYLTQGCTTIVTGNCGSGPIEVASYYDEIDQFGVGVNVAHLLPQGNLRREVLGSEQREATAEELKRMKALARKAMTDGAWGMSTGLIYVPSSYADTDELVELAKVVGEHKGIYVSHIRGEGLTLLNSVDEAIEIGRRAGLPVHISHFKSSGKDAWGLVRLAAEKIEQQRVLGVRVTADQYPYAASSTSLDATLIPTWARAGGRKKLIKRLDDKEQGPRLVEEISRKLRKTDDGQRIQIANYTPEPSWAGKRLLEIARDEEIEPLDLALQITRGGGAQIVNHGMNEEDVRFAMTLPWVATASDGRAYVPSSTVPHPRNYGTFPRKVGFYAIRENVMPLPQAVRSATGLPADILGIKDRGYVRKGHFADVIVWDPEELTDSATFAKPHSYSEGVIHVFVNGNPALANGTPTGALSGRVLRHASESSEQMRQEID